MKSPDWIDESIELSIVCFEAVITVLYLQMTYMGSQISFLLQFFNSLAIGRIFISIDDTDITGWIKLDELL